MVLMQNPDVTNAEDLIVEIVRDSRKPLSPAEVLDIIRSRDVRDDVARAALWFLLDRRIIVLTPGWRVAMPHPTSL